MASSTSGLQGEGAAARRMLGGVPRVVLLLGLVSLLNDLSGEMVTPLLPLFLVGALGAPVAVVGLVEGSADSATALLKVWVGHRSDKMRSRKPFILGGYGLSAAAKPIVALSSLWPQALVGRVLDRTGKGIRGAPRDAAIADATPKEILGRSFGVHRAFDTAGAIAGSLAALGLVLFLAGTGTVRLSAFQLIFLVASVPGAVSVVLLFVGLRETKAAAESAAARAARPGFVEALRLLPSPVRRFIVVSGIFAVGNFTIGLFILRVNEFSGGSVAAGLVAYIAFNVVATALSIPAGVLADRHGRRPLVAGAFVLFAGACAAFASLDTLNSYAAAVAAFLVYGAFTAVWEASYRAYMSEICPKDLRATALGAQGTVLGLLTLPGSLLAGVLWGLFGAVAAFEVGAVVAGVALAAFAVLRPGPASLAAA